MQIPGTDAVGGQRSAGTTSGSSKGKEKEATTELAPKAGSRSPYRDVGVSTGPSTSPEKKRRLVCGDKSSFLEISFSPFFVLVY
jgi:hypothetical protein